MNQAALVAAAVAALVIFGAAGMAAAGAPIPDADKQLLIGLILGGGGGAGVTYGIMRRPPVAEE